MLRAREPSVEVCILDDAAKGKLLDDAWFWTQEYNFGSVYHSLSCGCDGVVHRCVGELEGSILSAFSLRWRVDEVAGIVWSPPIALGSKKSL